MIFILTMTSSRSLFLCSLIASPAVSRMITSPIHIIKLRNYGGGLDLAKLFRENKGRKENGRSFRGMKISNFVTNGVDVKDKWSVWDKDSKLWPVNIIPRDSVSFFSRPLGITKKDKIKYNEILRPEVKFTSNARPVVLKWRQLEYEATQILPPSGKQKSKKQLRLNKKFSSKVPVHLGHARRLGEHQEPPTFKISHPQYTGSSITWLPASSYGNGLPKTIIHLKYPLKSRKLNRFVDDDNINPVNNYL